MPKNSDLDTHFHRIYELGSEIKINLPIEKKGITSFRADLAGLLTVAIASTYENCVKEIIQNYAYRHHNNFGIFAANNYEKLNSKIKISDLHKYAKTFNPKTEVLFKEKLNLQKCRIKNWTGIDITNRYDEILKWRHAFAHAGQRNTTVEEALSYHRYAKHVLISFANAFDNS